MTNGALLKTLGPRDGLYVVSSLIQVYMQLWCGQRKGAFWGLFRQLMEQAVPFPRKLHVLLKKNSCIYFLILPSFLFFDQGRRSCPRASCFIYIGLILRNTFFNSTNFVIVAEGDC